MGPLAWKVAVHSHMLAAARLWRKGRGDVARAVGLATTLGPRFAVPEVSRRERVGQSAWERADPGAAPNQRASPFTVPLAESVQNHAAGSASTAEASAVASAWGGPPAIGNAYKAPPEP